MNHQWKLVSGTVSLSGLTFGLTSCQWEVERPSLEPIETQIGGGTKGRREIVVHVFSHPPRIWISALERLRCRGILGIHSPKRPLKSDDRWCWAVSRRGFVLTAFLVSYVRIGNYEQSLQLTRGRRQKMDTWRRGRPGTGAIREQARDEKGARRRSLSGRN